MENPIKLIKQKLSIYQKSTKTSMF